MSGGEPAVHLAAIVLKATAILLAAALLAGLGRGAPARALHALWTAALAAVVLLPVLHFALPAHTPAWLRANALAAWTAPAPAHAGPRTVAASAAERAPVPAAGTAPRAPARVPWGRLALGAWACGAAVAGGRVLAGAMRRRRIGATAAAREDAGCRERLARVSARLGVRPPRLRMLPGAVPATWGVLRPVVVLPTSARRWPPDRLDAVLHHELAHVRRRDALWCGVAECACALFWFHPGVWMARRAAVRAQEQAADDLVLRTGAERLAYARALVETARLYARPAAESAPAFFGDRSELAPRLRRLTHPGPHPDARGWRVFALPLVLAAAIGFIVPLAPAAAGPAPTWPTAIRPDRPAARVPPAAEPGVVHPTTMTRESAPASLVPPRTRRNAGPGVEAGAAGDGYGRALADAGLRGVSPAALTRLRNLGVTPSYVRQMRDAGLGLQLAGDAVSLWIQGVTPDFVRQVRGAGMPLQAPADAVELWIHRVPTAFIRELADAGVDVSRPASIRVLHNHGVQPAYVRALARAGLPLRHPGDVLEMHIHRVPAGFVAALAERGLHGLTAREARRLHNFGIDPRDPAQIRTVSGYDRALARVPSLLPG